MRSLGYITKENNLVTFNEVRKFDDEEYEKYLDALENIYEIDDKISLFHMIFINYFDFQEYMENMIINYHHNSIIQSKTKTDVNNLNCKLNNFLSSIRLFLDHSDRKLKKKYAPESEEYILFDNKTSELFDSYFSYRFLYKLRNYVQHNNVAITYVNIFEDEDMISLSIALDRNLLLNDFNWGKVKKDLENQNDLIEIFPLMTEMLVNLKILSIMLIKSELDKINDSIEFINNLIDEIDKQYIPVTFNSNRDIEYSDFPIDLINFINYVLD